MTQTLTDKLSAFLRMHLTRDTLEDLEKNIISRYGDVDSYIKNNFTHIPKQRLRQQMRRYNIDEALCMSGGIVCNTYPRGENYIVIDLDNVKVSHVEVAHNKRIRDAAHRKLLSQLNTILEPIQIDLFDADKKTNFDSKLHAVIVVAHPAASESSQSTPNDIFITIPFSNWRGFHLFVPISEFILGYMNEEHHQPVFDMAWPTLLVEIKDEEAKQSNE
ncbi:hypothetical protein DZ860_16760 [Vibrio sinensis]|uniref:Uncharacterized protein n=1 Tax=Vibrio sinensis TaxID=2302434 RepID=A0A3A6Q9S3_9VIBR|nr:hypothetical protein [Vibrio sinensis]RJX68644.1 hypothetical protein DZ860_16760 [Vibrio sinensis]